MFGGLWMKYSIELNVAASPNDKKYASQLKGIVLHDANRRLQGGGHVYGQCLRKQSRGTFLDC